MGWDYFDWLRLVLSNLSLFLSWYTQKMVTFGQQLSKQKRLLTFGGGEYACACVCVEGVGGGSGCPGPVPAPCLRG